MLLPVSCVPGIVSDVGPCGNTSYSTLHTITAKTRSYDRNGIWGEIDGSRLAQTGSRTAANTAGRIPKLLRAQDPFPELKLEVHFYSFVYFF